MKYPAPTWGGLIRAEAPGWFLDRMAHYTDRQRSFLVYEHGTAVFDNGSSEPDIAKCNAALLDVVTHMPDFSVRPMRDGNFIVEFRGPVYGLVEGTFFKQNRQQLSLDAKKHGLFPTEKLLYPSEESVKAGEHVIGLYARANLYLDVESPVVVGRFTPPV
ncbi:hypothetical protein [Bradyrhizobium sp. OK095]|jgi:hypothetical protein|uniref:hypothetical protein n=1 Tax=Bradyrhizobium sp. OK095 TaxID=1882760 RepID=UPI0008B8EF02|nr:hypothetical protein [Bradyrhizobium sp. OK095]SEO30956.1 hypothetical protein SAMN05443254_1392 [Bradyrhizobium sp. OK095]